MTTVPRAATGARSCQTRARAAAPSSAQRRRGARGVRGVRGRRGDQPRHGRIGGDPAEEIRPRPHDRQVGQAVPAQVDRDRQVEHHPDRIMACLTGPPGREPRAQRLVQAGDRGRLRHSEPPAEEINGPHPATT
jgi:hypothetical protein